MKKIVLIPSCFIPKIVMEITVPKDRDEEEYIDALPPHARDFSRE